MKKKIQIFVLFIVVLSLLMPLKNDTLPSSAASAKLTDISKHWAKSYIENLVSLNAITGYPDKTFKPDGKMSRAAFITVIMKALKIAPTEASYFDDTSTHWAKGYISSAVDYGLLKLTDYYSNNRFKFYPDQNITRGEMAKIITCALGKEYQALSYYGKLDQFKDNTSISAGAKGYINEAYQTKIISGYPDQTFGATKLATRAEACAMIVKLLDYAKQSSGVALDGETIYKNYYNSVVKLITYDSHGKEYASGSGFIITKGGKVVTNYHVIEGSYSIIAQFPDGTQKKVISVANYNIKLDVAVLKLEAGQYTPVSIGSDRLLNVGSKIYTLGYPLDQALTISDGLISSKNYVLDSNFFIQISAPISSGNSGGPLVDKYGNVIGINARSNRYGQNINLSVPISLISNLLYRNENTASLAEVANPKSFKRDTAVSGRGLDGSINELDLATKKVIKVISTESPYLYQSNLSTLRYSLDLEHDAFTKNNSFYYEIVIRDLENDEWYYDYGLINLNGTNRTHCEIDLLDATLNDFDAGTYILDFYIADELINTSFFNIQDHLNYSILGQTSSTLKVYDYDQFDETGSRNVINQFIINSTYYLGIEFRADFASNFNTSKSILYKMEILGPNGLSIVEYFTGYIVRTTNSLIFIGGIGIDPRNFEPGNYTVNIYHENQLLASQTLLGKGGIDAEIPPQKITVQFADFQTEIVQPINLAGTMVMDVGIKVGFVNSDTFLAATYVIKSKADPTKILQTDAFESRTIEKEDSNSVINLHENSMHFNSVAVAAVTTGDTLLMDIIIEGVIIDTVELDI